MYDNRHESGPTAVDTLPGSNICGNFDVAATLLPRRFSTEIRIELYIQF